MLIAIITCLLSLSVTLHALRRGLPSLGLPFAYMVSLLLLHLPGAYVALVSPSSTEDLVKRGVLLTTAGCCAFSVAVALVAYQRRKPNDGAEWSSKAKWVIPTSFTVYCLILGWGLTFLVRPIVDVASLNAVIERGSGIWMLGATLGLISSVRERSPRAALLWLLAALVVPAATLIGAGFIGYGAAAIIIVVSVFGVLAKRLGSVVITSVVVCIVGLSIFANYFSLRDELRSLTWKGGSYEERLSVTRRVFTEAKLLDPEDSAHLLALEERLNQNLFVGLAAERLERGQVSFIHGRSILDAFIALVPRFLWPDKPVFGGSGTIVSDMTGLQLSTKTSWGVGNVMEFYINFGWLGLVMGFAMLGWAIAKLDEVAASALVDGNHGKALIVFLPCVALIQPNGSMVELAGGASSALIAALGMKWGWAEYCNYHQARGQRRKLER